MNQVSLDELIREIMLTIEFKHSGWCLRLRGQCKLLVRLLQSEMHYLGEFEYTDARRISAETLEEILFENITRSCMAWKQGDHHSVDGAAGSVCVQFYRECTIEMPARSESR